jgi:hypothetical protein
MPRHPGAHRAEKRRKELKRQKKQEAKRLRRDEKSLAQREDGSPDEANPDQEMERDLVDSVTVEDAPAAEQGERDS